MARCGVRNLEWWEEFKGYELSKIKIEHMECKFCISMNKCEGFVRVDDQERDTK